MQRERRGGCQRYTEVSSLRKSYGTCISKRKEQGSAWLEISDHVVELPRILGIVSSVSDMVIRTQPQIPQKFMRNLNQFCVVKMVFERVY